MNSILLCFCFCGAILLGHDADTGNRFNVPPTSFRTHWHLIGATGKGKTTAIEAILHQLFTMRERAAHFIFDRMGSFSHSLLRYLSSPYCPQSVKDRVLYIDASREDKILPFNPLLYDTLSHGYYKVSRACEVILRAWSSQNIAEMPRLARWLFNAMWAAAQLGLTVADCVHLLMPGSDYHAAILSRLPPLLRAEWGEILDARGGEAGRILESSRNRIKPFKESPILSWIFGTVRSLLDAVRLLREARIVIIDLSPKNRLSPQVADAIGGMMLNEILAVMRSQSPKLRYPAYLWLDEFQRFVGPDIEEAIPEIRQLGGRMIFSHQSFSQLIQGDTDLSSLIWQPQSRMIFGVQGEDAELLANEVASLTYDPMKIKDDMYSRRQLIKDHRIIQLGSWSESEASAENWQSTYGTNWTASNGKSAGSGWNHVDSHNVSRKANDPTGDYTQANGRADGTSGSDVTTETAGQGGSTGSGNGGSRSRSSSHSVGESLLPVYDEFQELSRRTYYTFEEQRALWAQQIRLLETGQALVKIVDDPKLYRINVQKHSPGYLGADIEQLVKRYPATLESVDRFIEQNYTQDFFVTPAAIELETRERLEQLLTNVIYVPLLPMSGNAPDQVGNVENPLA